MIESSSLDCGSLAKIVYILVLSDCWAIYILTWFIISCCFLANYAALFCTITGWTTDTGTGTGTGTGSTATGNGAGGGEGGRAATTGVGGGSIIVLDDALFEDV